MAGCLLEFAGVSREFPAAGGASVVRVLRDVDLEVRAGETVAIVGPSGSGKSSLLNLAGALDRPTRGRVMLDGEGLEGMSEQELAAVRNRKIGFVFQFHHLLPQCTVLENVLVPTLAPGNRVDPSRALDRARRLLQRVGLEPRLHHRPSQLSGGERQRAAVVRAVINEPKLLLADEPTGSLDQESAANLGVLLVELNREEGVTLLMVTHSRELAGRMRRVLELRGGALQAGAA